MRWLLVRSVRICYIIHEIKKISRRSSRTVH